MIDQEQIADWAEHPVTRLYMNNLQKLIDRENDISKLALQKSASDVGLDVMVLAGYLEGMAEAKNYRNVLEGQFND